MIFIVVVTELWDTVHKQVCFPLKDHRNICSAPKQPSTMDKTHPTCQALKD